MLSGETIKLYLLFCYRKVNGTVVAQLSLANNCLVFFHHVIIFLLQEGKK